MTNESGYAASFLEGGRGEGVPELAQPSFIRYLLPSGLTRGAQLKVAVTSCRITQCLPQVVAANNNKVVSHAHASTIHAWLGLAGAPSRRRNTNKTQPSTIGQPAAVCPECPASLAQHHCSRAVCSLDILAPLQDDVLMESTRRFPWGRIGPDQPGLLS
ncbi:hypothetical protein Micbo1qcDRAFT_175987 [Microdochium bolleyi]|uniref:Uncharacterized protein n=1 Tax=Microdochium bolleyi TaxID=196109 RepID=A0A136J179_9PEZI|nr:hypothetical protein Micbo1qcDRAFT_175987 [Microdochium bolleyi]